MMHDAGNFDVVGIDAVQNLVFAATECTQSGADVFQWMADPGVIAKESEACDDTVDGSLG